MKIFKNFNLTGTIYPGLMVTSAIIYRLCWLLNITIDIRNVCVFLAPLFSSFTTIITYLLTKEIKNAGAGLVAAAMVAIVPGYISRSVAGSYDNEGIAIFCMLLTYYTWIKAVKSGSIYWGTTAALAYFYMVGYTTFVTFFLLINARFLLGFFVGWLCIPNKFDTIARFGFNGNWAVFTPCLRGLQHFVLCGDHTVHADFFRWFPAGAKFRAYARK